MALVAGPLVYNSPVFPVGLAPSEHTLLMTTKYGGYLQAIVHHLKIIADFATRIAKNEVSTPRLFKVSKLAVSQTWEVSGGYP